VRAELEVGPRALRRPESERRSRTDELLTALRLEGLAEANPFTLSGGEKRRLSVATAIASRPRMLVLDEPTFGQDARTWVELVGLLARLRDGAEGDGPGTAIVAITHDPDIAGALGAEVFTLAGTGASR
jgi:energy-coupling factor transport system ATP-binding protein